jgi:hypothetical protein
MMPTPTLGTLVLALNALWDALCVCGLTAHLGRLPTTRRDTSSPAREEGRGRRGCALVWLLSEAHVGLWVAEEDQQNRACTLLMLCLVLHWGAMRLLGALRGPTSEVACVCASTTYVLEAALVASQVALGHMHGLRGWGVVVGCAVCWGLVVNECAAAAV